MDGIDFVSVCWTRKPSYCWLYRRDASASQI